MSSLSGRGLQFSNADGTYIFNSSTSLSGASTGLDIVNGSTGSFTFSQLDINDAPNNAVRIKGGTVDIQGGTFQTIAGDAILIDNATLDLNDVVFEQILDDIIDASNSNFSGAGNAATNFGSLSNDRGGNTGTIDFGAAGTAP